jgi:hypothetical protein
VGQTSFAVLHVKDRRKEPRELCRDYFCFAEMYCCLISLFFAAGG